MLLQRKCKSVIDSQNNERFAWTAPELHSFFSLSPPLPPSLSLSVTLLPCFACLGTFSGNAAALGASNLDYLHNCLAVGNLCKELKFCSLKLSAYSDILHQ